MNFATIEVGNNLGDHIGKLSAMILATATAVVTSGLMTGCGVSVNDATSRSDGKPMGLSTDGCINQALPSIQNYFNSKSSPTEVAQTWQCFSSNLQMFSLYISPANPNYYTKAELQGFLQKFVMGPNVNLSDDLMTQVMKVKQVVLGGDNDKISRAELTRAQQLITTLQQQTINLLPHLRILLMKEEIPSDVTADDVEAAHAAMSQFIDALVPYLNAAPIAYDVASAQAMLKDFDELYTHVDGWDGPATVINYLNSFAAFKAFFAKAPGNAIAGTEWGGLFHQLGDAYAIWLRYHYAIDHAQSMTADANLAQWSLIAGQVRDLLNTSVTAKDSNVIDFATIDAMVHEVYRLDFFTMPLTETTLKGALRPILGTILNPATNRRRTAVNGITTATLDYVLKNAQALLEMQSLYLQAVDKAGSASRVTYRTLRQIWPTLAHTYTDAWRQMQALISAKFPLYVSPDETLIYDDTVIDGEITPSHYFDLNWQRAAVGIVIYGYSANPTSTQLSGLSATEFQRIYNDLHPVAEELGLFKAGDTKTWTSLAQYAEMFMPSSNGGTGVTFNEGMELLNTLLSGSKIGGALFSDLSSQCKAVSVDSAGTLAIPIACFRRNFRADVAREFQNFPSLISTVNDLSGDDLNDFLDNLQSSMRTAGTAATAPFTSTEISNAANFLHFVESIMWRFDANHDGQLSERESVAAYPVFKQILIQASGMSKDSDLQAVYTYLLKYKESPKQNLWNEIKFLWWKGNSGSWSYQDSRADLVAVMARISEATH